MNAEWPRAFALAAQARDAADAIIASVRSGDVDLAQAYLNADADPLVGRVFAVKVFEAVPEIGKVRSRRTMADVGLADDVTLAEVPAEARAEIIARFAEPGSVTRLA